MDNILGDIPTSNGVHMSIVIEPNEKFEEYNYILPHCLKVANKDEICLKIY